MAGSTPSAEQAVAAAEMMVQKAKRSADREGMEPQRDLGQFHRHRVLVHPVDAPLEHHAADDVPVVELGGIECPAPVLRIVHDRVADPVDPLHQWREVSVHKGFGLGHRLDNAVGKVVHEVDQEVSGAHGRVADLQFQQLFRRVEPLQATAAAGLPVPGLTRYPPPWRRTPRCARPSAVRPSPARSGPPDRQACSSCPSPCARTRSDGRRCARPRGPPPVQGAARRSSRVVARRDRGS